jgi:hypothetical protein
VLGHFAPWKSAVSAAEVAHAIGEELGWHVYDHELVEWIARDMGVRADLLESVDERRMSWLTELLQGFTSGPVVSPVTYSYHLAQTLLSLAAHGECILVGRGAAQLLPPETTLRLRLVGPLKDRVAAVQRRLGCSAEEAARWVEQTEREWRAFVVEHFDKDPADADGYDLILGAFRYASSQCAQLTATALRLLQGQPLRQTTPSADAGASA